MLVSSEYSNEYVQNLSNAEELPKQGNSDN